MGKLFFLLPDLIGASIHLRRDEEYKIEALTGERFCHVGPVENPQNYQRLSIERTTKAYIKRQVDLFDGNQVPESIKSIAFAAAQQMKTFKMKKKHLKEDLKQEVGRKMRAKTTLHANSSQENARWL